MIPAERSLYSRNMIQTLCKREIAGHFLNLIKNTFRNLKKSFSDNKSCSQYLY